MMKRNNNFNQSGFSLIELSIATAILGVILLMLSSIFIRLVQQERGAVNLRDAMQSTRSALGDIATSTRLATDYAVVPPDASGFGQLCLYQSGTTVHYFVGSSPSDTVPGLYRVNDSISAPCNRIDYTAAAVIATPTRLFGANIQTTAFVPWAKAAGQPVPLLTVRLGTGSTPNPTTDLDATGNCGPRSDYACSVSVLETSISLRGVQ